MKRGSWISILDDTVAKYPNKIACIDETIKYSFIELKNKSIEIANEIVNYSSYNEPVVIIMDKGCLALAAIWGTLYAQSFYVIVESTLPISRKQAILKQLGAKVILTTSKFLQEIDLLSFAGEIIYISEKVKPLQNKSQTLQQRAKNYAESQLMYAMFTSGSTGNPKCVTIQHSGVLDFIVEFVSLFQIDSNDVIANQAPFDFDVSVKDIFSAAITGASIIFVPKSYFSFPKQLIDFLEKYEVTVLTWAVSALCIMSKSMLLQENQLTNLRKIIFSGEVMPMQQLRILFKAAQNAQFFNVYGPSEITCNCSHFQVQKSDLNRDFLPIGTPFRNKVVRLVSDDKLIESSCANRKGEIMISGSGLSLGYYNDIEQTEKVFIQNPLQKKYREIVYMSGDLGFYDEDGLLNYSGRKDNQIKRFGHRIELKEIELSILKIDGILDVCCVYTKENDCLCAFVVSENQCDAVKIKSSLKSMLPRFMIPNLVIEKSKIPINKNGKIDRKVLEIEMK